IAASATGLSVGLRPDGPVEPRPGVWAGALAMARGFRARSLRSMLMLACVGVVLLGIAGLACATVVTSESDVHSLVSRRQVAVDRAGAATVVALWRHSRSWRTFPLGPVLNLADQAGVAIRIQDRAGHGVGPSPGFGSRSSRGRAREPG